MNVPTRLGAFALGLGLVFAAAVGVGNAVGPVGVAEAPAHSGGHGDEHTAAVEPAEAVEGLSVSQDGYTLVLDQATLPAATPTELAFTVRGPDGEPLTGYTETHERDLHLIVVRRDGSGYQHVHPERDPDGRWSVPLILPEAGAYKVLADFTPAGREDALTLAADVQVPGVYDPAPVPPTTRTAAVDGYTVTVDGHLDPGEQSALTFTVRRNGEPVTDLEPYLGAYGHLVALRSGDLGYVHVHADGHDAATGPQIPFVADVPTAGDYLLYLDFQHDGVVRTATFAVEAEEHA